MSVVTSLVIFASPMDAPVIATHFEATFGAPIARIEEHAGGDKTLQISVLAAGLNYVGIDRVHEATIGLLAKDTVLFPECLQVHAAVEDGVVQLVFDGSTPEKQP